MAVPVAALAKLAAAALSDENTRRKLGWIVAAICSPLILTLALICSLLSGSAEHNNSAVLLCFHGGDIPGKTPAEYVAYIEDMRRSFTLLDDAIAVVDHDIITIASGVVLGDRHRSAQRGADGRAGGDCQVHAGVPLALPGDGIDAVTEFRGDTALPA